MLNTYQNSRNNPLSFSCLVYINKLTSLANSMKDTTPPHPNTSTLACLLIPFQKCFYPILSQNPKTNQQDLCLFSLLSSFSISPRVLFFRHQSFLPFSSSYCFSLPPASSRFLLAPPTGSPHPVHFSGLSENTPGHFHSCPRPPLHIVRLIS